MRAVVSLTINLFLFAFLSITVSNLVGDTQRTQETQLKLEKLAKLKEVPDLDTLFDSWGNRIEWNFTVVRSAGPDGLFLTEDDITVWRIVD